MSGPEQPMRDKAPIDVVRVPKPRRPVSPEPLVAVPSDVLVRYNARVLDPTTAMQVAGQRPIRPTVYVADRLIVSSASDADVRGALEEAARRFGLQLVGDDPQRALRAAEVARRADRPLNAPYRVRLVPNSAAATAAPDAWSVLQTFRGLIGRDSVGQRQASLDHLMTAAGGPDIGGSPFVQGHGIVGSPFVQGHGVGGSPFVQGHGYGSSEYGVPGWGGRQPVTWLGTLPPRNERLGNRRPVVAVVDTGVGSHPWLPPDIVDLEPMVLDVPIANPEVSGVTGSPYEGLLDADAGHGTFIAGLIRQQCPDADILAVQVMGGDGVVAESNLLDVLHLLALRQQIAVESNDPDRIIDVLSLSLGYYHEQPDDITYDAQLLEPLLALGRLGVSVVVAAGNDSTDRPMFPAAFTPWPGGPVTAPDKDCLPVISVGALNPNATIALFSNAGAWVCCHRQGAALVSTYPITINAAEQASVATSVGGDGARSTIDPDDFSSGFAVWSGTSFAGPVLAGEIAGQLGRGDLSAIDVGTAVGRGWAAVAACVDGLHP
jgi:subtilisin family serine protease